MTETYGDTYKLFFKSLMDQQEKIDGPRNKVVHWIVLTSRRGGKPFDPETDINLHEHPNPYNRRTLSVPCRNSARERSMAAGSLSGRPSVFPFARV